MVMRQTEVFAFIEARGEKEDKGKTGRSGIVCFMVSTFPKMPFFHLCCSVLQAVTKSTHKLVIVSVTPVTEQCFIEE